jgi:hypothetical protein
MTVTRIISGGQTGADRGALVAGKQMSLATGGWMPRGFLTEDGPSPWLRDLYGMQEHPSAQYPPRTRQNVKDADGTIWVGDPGESDSRGQRATFRAVEEDAKPYLRNPDARTLRQWADTYHIATLNVAGPRGSRDPQAHQRAFELLIAAFRGVTL